MSSSTDLRMLTRYSAWADDRRYSNLSGLPPETLATARPGRPHGMLGILAHICAVDRIWRGHLEGRPHGLTSRHFDTVPDFHELTSL